MYPGIGFGSVLGGDGAGARVHPARSRNNAHDDMQAW